VWSDVPAKQTVILAQGPAFVQRVWRLKMKQLELINKRPKPKFCNWIMEYKLSGTFNICDGPAVVTIGHAGYCAKYAEAAQKMFGPGQAV
jgi:hypothetical protein